MRQRLCASEDLEVHLEAALKQLQLEEVSVGSMSIHPAGRCEEQLSSTRCSRTAVFLPEIAAQAHEKQPFREPLEGL